jgi:hypothetical protein
MVEHICPLCNSKFNKKSRLTEHLTKKNTCIQIQSEKDTNLSTQMTAQITHKNAEITHEIYDDENTPIEFVNEPNICKYCLKTFSRADVLTRHLKNYCKVKKKQDEEKEDIFKRLLLQETLLKEKDAQIHKLISQNDVLINKICVLEEKVDKISNSSNSKSKKSINNTTNMTNSNNTTNNTTNTTNTLNTSNTSNTNNGIIVQLVNYGKEDLDKIDIKHFINNIVKNNKVCGVKIPEEILKLIHFNPAYPELNNIYISDINREKCMIYDDGMWKLSPDDKIPEVIEKVVSFSYDKENELREKYSNNKPLMDRLNTINKYTKFNDGEYLETLKEEQEEEQNDNKDEIKRCEDFQKKTYDTFKTTLYNEGQKIKNKKQKNLSNKTI